MRNLIKKKLVIPKKNKLEMIYIDIAKPFTKILQKNIQLLKIVNNAIKKTWSLLLKTKNKTIPILQNWKKQEKLQTGTKVKIIRSDNAPKLKKVIFE